MKSRKISEEKIKAALEDLRNGEKYKVVSYRYGITISWLCILSKRHLIFKGFWRKDSPLKPKP